MPDIAALIAERMLPRLLDLARMIGRTGGEAGVRPYLVGGSVRDVLMDQPGASDLDVTLHGAGQATFDLIAERVGARLTRRSQFTTASLETRGVTMDLAMTRAEEYPQPGSLPVVRPGTLAQDLARRDFSVNAMAVSLADVDFGQLHDPHGGWADIRARKLRILHAGSFRDDATRVLRAARYATRLSLEPTVETVRAVRASTGFMSTISASRVRNELERLFVEESAPDAMRLLSEWGALPGIHPALAYDEESWNAVGSEGGPSSDDARIGVAYAVLGAGTSGADVSGIIARLQPASRYRRILRQSAEVTPRLVGDRIRRLSWSALADLLDPLHEYTVAGCSLASSGVVRSRLRRYLDDLRDMRLYLTGNDLMQLGVTEGPEVGRVLTELRRARLDGEVRTRDDERALALRLIHGDGRA